ncbi:hypothetical protein ACHAW6_014898 [Cyclotella cf. meneghiniana]
MHRLLPLFLLLLNTTASTHGFTAVPSKHKIEPRHHRLLFSTERTATEFDHHQDKEQQRQQLYAQSFQIIDSCAASAQPSDQLYASVRYIDKNAHALYKSPTDKQQLWDRCKGSWKLQLATGPPSSKSRPTFKPVPIFAFAMIDDENFGNGIGWNQDGILLSLLGNHSFDERRRQMGIGIDHVFLFSSNVTQFVPRFVAEGMGLGKRREDWERGSTKMPAFTMIGASDKSMIARGGSGGIAIWTRLEKDIRPAAYGREYRA